MIDGKLKHGLFIAEKPSVERTCRDVYTRHRGEFPFSLTFCSQRGHLLTLKMPHEVDPVLKKWSWDTLPMFMDDHGGYKYKVIPSSREKYDNIKNELKSGKYDFIVHAGDSDQEGELLVRLVLSDLKNRLPVYRYWENGTSDTAVMDGLRDMRPDTEKLYENFYRAALIRQHSDYDIGMNSSRAGGLKLNMTGFAMGRVKAVILSLVYNRDMEIANFVPKTDYQVVATYGGGFGGLMFDPRGMAKAEGTAKDGKKDNTKGVIRFDTEAEALRHANSLRGKPAIIESVEVKDVSRSAPKLYDLGTLQSDASARLGMSPDRALEMCQSLYERKILSYPRTDCPYLGTDMDLRVLLRCVACDPALAETAGRVDTAAIAAVRKNRSYVNDEKLAKGGHFAIVGDQPFRWDSLSKAEQAFVDLVFRRLLSIFLPPLRTKNTRMVADIGGSKFRTTGKTLVDRGYTVLYDTKVKETFLPEMGKGQQLAVTSIKPMGVEKKIPSPFTEATLTEALNNPYKFLRNKDEKYKELGDELRIGRPSTQAGIVKELLDKKYIELRGNAYHSTILGRTIMDAFTGTLLMDVDLTLEWEWKMHLIKDGDLSPDALADDNHRLVVDLVQHLHDKHVTPVIDKKKMTEFLMKCPSCGKDINETEKGFSCTGWREGCKVGLFKETWGTSMSRDDASDLLLGKTIRKKCTTKSGTSVNLNLKYDFALNKVVRDQ